MLSGSKVVPSEESREKARQKTGGGSRTKMICPIPHCGYCVDADAHADLKMSMHFDLKHQAKAR
jgi:hypothetical protein